MTEPGLYLYLVASGAPRALGTGVDGAQLLLVPGPGDLSAVVHEHTTGPFEGADDVVRRRVLEHSDVVDRVWQAGTTVLPASFNVIVAPAPGVTARERLVRWMTDREAELTARTAAVRGRVELRVGVGLALDVVADEHPDLAGMRAELADRPPGVRRLLHRRLEERAREVADDAATDLYPQVRRRLASVAEALAENRRAHPPDGTVPVLDIALLVAHERVADVGRVLADLQEEQPAARVRYLGPWPPYSFADLADTGLAEAGSPADA